MPTRKPPAGYDADRIVFNFTCFVDSIPQNIKPVLKVYRVQHFTEKVYLIKWTKGLCLRLGSPMWVQIIHLLYVALESAPLGVVRN